MDWTRSISLDEYLRHAKRFGPECIFQTALEQGYLTTGEMVTLLKVVGAPKDERISFARLLLEGGSVVENVMHFTQLSRKQVNVLSEALESDSDAISESIPAS